MPPKQRKLAVMGSRAVGKSTVTIQFVDKQFVEAYNATIENTYHAIINANGVDYDTEIVDTAGQVCEASYPSPHFCLSVCLFRMSTQFFKDNIQ